MVGLTKVGGIAASGKKSIGSVVHVIEVKASCQTQAASGPADCRCEYIIIVLVWVVVVSGRPHN